MAEEAARKVVAAQQSRRLQQLLRLAPWLLALFFTLWSLRGLEAGNVVNTDAARHAMNGAFVYDLVRHGEFLRPIEYGKEYYGKLPALSLPYHPPLFPLIEAVFFALFGVKLWAARLAVALAVGVCVLLLYKLVVHLLGSHLVAACSVVTFCFWRIAQAVGGDVMLEYPSLAFALGALWQLRDIASGLPARRALAFALLGAAAVWTKQQAVFVGAVPFFWILLARRWSLLRNPWLWAAALTLIGSVVGLILLVMPFRQAGMEHLTPASEVGQVIRHHLFYYADLYRRMFGWAAVIGAACIITAAAIIPRLRRAAAGSGLTFFWAWAGATLAALMMVSSFEARYLFYLQASLTVITMASLWRLARGLGAMWLIWFMPAVSVAAMVYGMAKGPVFVEGPAQAAALIVAGHRQRVLFCGSLDGHFIFAVRERDPNLQTLVIPGERVGSELFKTELEGFARTYGIHWVVIERSSQAQPCSAPTGLMRFQHRVALRSSQERWRSGDLSLYRYPGAAAQPEKPLALPVPRIGSQIAVRFNGQ